MLKLMVHPEKCSGCRMCEIVCSYHHTKAFSRKTSSIHVKREERKGEFTLMIKNKNGRENERPLCDLCVDEEEPLCVKFCSTNALSLQEM